MNAWTRGDLPSLPDVLGDVTTHERGEGAAAYCTAALAHLNAHHPKPSPVGNGGRYPDWMAQVEPEMARVEQEQRDRAEQAERERDAAVARAEAHAKGATRANLDRDTAYEELAGMTRDRDEWKARAEQAERELADPYSQTNQDAAAWQRVAAHPALKMELLPEADHTYAGRVFQRITWLAETSEAVTELQPAPVVDRDVVEAELVNGLHRGFTAEQLARRVCAAIDSDPAVHVVRESDIAAVEVERGSEGGWGTESIAFEPGRTVEEVRDWVGIHIRSVAECEAIARHIEAEQAEDPAEEQTDALADILYGDEMVTDQMRGVLERVVRAGMLFPEQEADQ